MGEKCDNKEQRQIYRFSLHPDLHKDIIEMLDERTKTERPQLFVDAMRYFRKHCRYVEKTGDGNEKENAAAKETAPADLAEIFHFQQG